MIVQGLEKGRDVIGPGGPEGAMEKAASQAAKIGELRTGALQRSRGGVANHPCPAVPDTAPPADSAVNHLAVGMDIHWPTVVGRGGRRNPIRLAGCG
jgi:hypothetical protein